MIKYEDKGTRYMRIRDMIRYEDKSTRYNGQVWG